MLIDLHMPHHIKDILIGLLVAYVVADLLLAYATKSRHPGLFAALQTAMNDENVAVVLVIAACVGILAYVAARRSSKRSGFSTKKE
jgi:hypothetical protein